MNWLSVVELTFCRRKSLIVLGISSHLWPPIFDLAELRTPSWGTQTHTHRQENGNI